MAQYSFGSGVLFGFRNDSGAGVATPIEFGAVQEVSIDLSFNVKQLYGQSQFPLSVARGTGKVTGKAKMGRILGRTMADLFFGETLATGQVATAFHETGTIPTTPYQLTAANTATYLTDLGVTFVATGIPLKKVASAPTSGQYSVSAAGVYTFAAADTGKAVMYSYTYSVAATGNVITINNNLLGFTPTFQMNFYETYQGQQLNFQLNQCTSEKFMLPTKLEDFTITELDFTAFADVSGVIGKVSIAEAS